MHGLTVSRLTAVSGGSSGPVVSGWLKSFAIRWFGGVKSAAIGVQPTSASLCTTILKTTQASSLVRWNLIDRFNQYAERNRLIDVYTRQYRRYVLPMRTSLRGFGTALGFAALVPALRSVDSNEFSTNVSEALEVTNHGEVWMNCRGFTQPKFGSIFNGDVHQLEELRILRRTNARDVATSSPRGALAMFVATKNSAVEAANIEVLDDTESIPKHGANRYEVDSVINVNEGALKRFEEQVEVHSVIASTSDKDGFSVVNDDCEIESTVNMNQNRVISVIPNISAAVENLPHEELELEETNMMTPSCDYSVISDSEDCQSTKFYLDLVIKPANNAGSVNTLCKSATETVVVKESMQMHETFGCELEGRFKVTELKSEMNAAADGNVRQWLSELVFDDDHQPALSERVVSDLWHVLYEKAEYFVYAYIDPNAIVQEFLNAAEINSTVRQSSALHLIAPRINIFRQSPSLMLSDQLVALHARRFGLVHVDSSLSCCSRRVQLGCRAEIIRTLCTLSMLQQTRSDVQFRCEPHRILQSHLSKQKIFLVVRQRAMSFRGLLHELEQEFCDSRTLPHQITLSSIQPFDSLVLQLLEFGWTALFTDRLRFVSFDFEQLIDVLGVELDKAGSPRLVLLDDGSSFWRLFTTSKEMRTTDWDMREPSAREAFASFSYTVYLSVSRIVEAFSLKYISRVNDTFAARQHLFEAMLGVQEENVDNLLAAMRKLREVSLVTVGK